jgi:short-subunit dehydrogenase
MPIDLRGKSILITGASSGIGAATAIECAKAGMPVTLMARRADKLEGVKRMVESAGGRAITIVGDVTDAAACAAAVDRTIEAFGSVYSVFANAGYGLERPVHESSEADIRAIFEANFYGTLNTIRPALPHMMRARTGHVLVCSSCLAKMTIPYFSVYSATKAAQNHLARGMRLELEPAGIHVSSVHPIGTKTEFFDTAQKYSGDVGLLEHTPSALMQTPSTVARAILRCLRRPKAEVWTSLFVRFGMSICTAFPALGDMGTRKMVRDYNSRRGASSPSAPTSATSRA